MGRPSTLRLERLRRGWRLQDLYRQTGIPASSISRIERGEQEPRADQVARLAAALQIDEEAVLSARTGPSELSSC